MNLKELIITFIIMLTVVIIVLAPLGDNNSAEEVRRDAQALQQEIKTKNINTLINAQYEKIKLN